MPRLFLCRQSASNRTCKALNKRGERCGSRAVERGLCAIHSGRVDPAEIGRKGGSRSPLTRLRREADDGLREQAREVLCKALSGENVDKSQLDAAKSLFAFRAAAPPAAEQSATGGAGKTVGLSDVLAVAVESGLVELHGTLTVNGKTWRRP